MLSFSVRKEIIIQEVIKFYNLGDKTFETDFSGIAIVISISKELKNFELP